MRYYGTKRHPCPDGWLTAGRIRAGAASTNGMLFLVSVLLMLAWKAAGYWGLDRWVLHYLGTPWPGAVPDQAAQPETKSVPKGSERDSDLDSTMSHGTA
jgi:hypothetical protein